MTGFREIGEGVIDRGEIDCDLVAERLFNDKVRILDYGIEEHARGFHLAVLDRPGFTNMSPHDMLDLASLDGQTAAAGFVSDCAAMRCATYHGFEDDGRL